MLGRWATKFPDVRQNPQFEHLGCLVLFDLTGRRTGVRDRMWVAATRPRRTGAAGIGPHGGRSPARHGSPRCARDPGRIKHVTATFIALLHQATYPPRPDPSPGPDSTRRSSTVKITGQPSPDAGSWYASDAGPPRTLNYDIAKTGHHHPQWWSCARSSSPGHETASVSTVTKVSTAILRAFAMVRLLTRAGPYRGRGGRSK
jgi:hypothetical protein